MIQGRIKNGTLAAYSDKNTYSAAGKPAALVKNLDKWEKRLTPSWLLMTEATHPDLWQEDVRGRELNRRSSILFVLHFLHCRHFHFSVSIF